MSGLTKTKGLARVHTGPVQACLPNQLLTGPHHFTANTVRKRHVLNKTLACREQEQHTPSNQPGHSRRYCRCLVPHRQCHLKASLGPRLFYRLFGKIILPPSGGKIFYGIYFFECVSKECVSKQCVFSLNCPNDSLSGVPTKRRIFLKILVANSRVGQKYHLTILKKLVTLRTRII